MTIFEFQHFAVVGGTGALGRVVTRELLCGKAKSVRVVTRKCSKAHAKEELRNLGAKVMDVDYSDFSSLVCYYDMFSNQALMIDAAKVAGVTRFVPSEYGIDIVGKDHPFLSQKQATRRYVEQSGLEYTYYITGFFIDHLITTHGGFDLKRRTATIIGSGKTPLSVTAMDDVARFIVRTINLTESRNAALTISGETTCLLKICQDITKVNKLDMKVNNIPIEEAVATVNQVPSPLDAITKMYYDILIMVENGICLNPLNHISLTNLTPISVVGYINRLIHPPTSECSAL
ncbi:hypothetical protein L0F63_005481 [Massospora cicadina]|nr:hypothetical protein L0F63_005481 [Massospora cicadina]